MGVLPTSAPNASERLTLDRLPPHRAAIVQGVACEEAGADRVRQLADLGFHVGEPVMVLARAWPAQDPLVVRIGGSRFALRRAEASCIGVSPLP